MPAQYPLGKGIWIRRVADCQGGDLEAIAARARSAGYRHAVLKVADGADRYNADPARGQDEALELTRRLSQAGLAVWGWHMVYGDRPRFKGPFQPDYHLLEAECALGRAAELREAGLRGYVINAEGDYERAPQREQRAAAFMDRLRAAHPDLPLALASWKNPAAHPRFPWTAFRSRCDLDMPQVFWIGRHGEAARELARAVRQFSRLTPRLPLVPTGPAFFESDWRPASDEIAEFLERAAALGLPAANLWDWDQLSLTGGEPHNPRRLDFSAQWQAAERAIWSEPAATPFWLLSAEEEATAAPQPAAQETAPAAPPEQAEAAEGRQAEALDPAEIAAEPVGAPGAVAAPAASAISPEEMDLETEAALAEALRDLEPESELPEWLRFLEDPQAPIPVSDADLGIVTPAEDLLAVETATQEKIAEIRESPALGAPEREQVQDEFEFLADLEARDELPEWLQVLDETEERPAPQASLVEMVVPEAVARPVEAGSEVEPAPSGGHDGRDELAATPSAVGAGVATAEVVTAFQRAQIGAPPAPAPPSAEEIARELGEDFLLRQALGIGRDDLPEWLAAVEELQMETAPAAAPEQPVASAPAGPELVPMPEWVQLPEGAAQPEPEPEPALDWLALPEMGAPEPELMPLPDWVQLPESAVPAAPEPAPDELLLLLAAEPPAPLEAASAQAVPAPPPEPVPDWLEEADAQLAQADLAPGPASAGEGVKVGLPAVRRAPAAGRLAPPPPALPPAAGDTVGLFFQALRAGNLEAAIACYGPEFAHVNQDRVERDREAVQAFYRQLLDQLNGHSLVLLSQRGGRGAVTARWAVRRPDGSDLQGTDTFHLNRDGRIVYHQTSYRPGR